MGVSAYKVVRVLLFVFLFFSIVEISVEMSAHGGGGVIIFTPLAIMAIVMFIALGQSFEVRKHFATVAYEKALAKVRQREADARMKGGRQSEMKNIMPLIDLTKKELRNRGRDVTPNILQTIEAKLTDYCARNDVPGVSKLYEVITQTKPDQLNAQLTKFSAGHQI
jgi:hypothetical protein